MSRTPLHQIDRSVIQSAMAQGRRERSLAFWALIGAMRSRLVSLLPSGMPHHAA